jgi:hypothetical protein
MKNNEIKHEQEQHFTFNSFDLQLIKNLAKLNTVELFYDKENDNITSSTKLTSESSLESSLESTTMKSTIKTKQPLQLFVNLYNHQQLLPNQMKMKLSIELPKDFEIESQLNKWQKKLKQLNHAMTKYHKQMHPNLPEPIAEQLNKKVENTKIEIERVNETIEQLSNLQKFTK